MISPEAFVDLYYAYDFNQPVQKERAYTTQPARHNEATVNLAFVGFNLEEKKWRGSLSLQAGSAVDANYAAEANENLGHIMESYIGYALGEQTWIDGGIFFSHLGMESWPSMNNPVYSRSLAADYSPYYNTGLRLTTEFNPTTHLEFHLMNGWQNISETNSAKAIGFQLKKTLKDSLLTYNNFLGDEKLFSNNKTRFRAFHNFILEKNLSESLRSLLSFDLGTEAQQEKSGVNAWYAFTALLEQELDEKNRLGYRLEYFSDPHELNVQTSKAQGFEVIGASLNVDHFFKPQFVWRNEVRFFYSQNPIYARRGSNEWTNGFFVTSVSFRLD